jgi:hypothetical protein
MERGERLRKQTILPVLALAAALAVAVAGTASAGGRKEEQSSVERLRPPVDGIDLQVVGGDRFLALRNDTGQTVVVEGYAGEPYLRFRPGGVVEENVRSPSKYVNDDRYGLTPVPAKAVPEAKPQWKPVSRAGSYRWFDHRIHSMDKGIPKQVEDPDTRNKIFDWNVPMQISGRPVVALGTLEWVPASASDDGTSPAAIVAIGAAVLVLLAAVAWLLSRRRRRTVPAVAAGGAAPPPASPKEDKEVW